MGLMRINVNFSYLFAGNLKGPKTSAGVKGEQQTAPPPIEVPALSLEELKEKTDNFGSKALIGEGSYGRVYYAVLDNGKHVAVKKLDVTSEPESNTEILTQVRFLIIYKICLCVSIFPLVSPAYQLLLGPLSPGKPKC